jgi:hypothetical protein
MFIKKLLMLFKSDEWHQATNEERREYLIELGLVEEEEIEEDA